MPHLFGAKCSIVRHRDLGNIFFHTVHCGSRNVLFARARHVPGEGLLGAGWPSPAGGLRRLAPDGADRRRRYCALGRHDRALLDTLRCRARARLQAHQDAGERRGIPSAGRCLRAPSSCSSSCSSSTGAATAAAAEAATTGASGSLGKSYLIRFRMAAAPAIASFHVPSFLLILRFFAGNAHVLGFHFVHLRTESLEHWSWQDFTC